MPGITMDGTNANATLNGSAPQDQGTPNSRTAFSDGSLNDVFGQRNGDESSNGRLEDTSKNTHPSNDEYILGKDSVHNVPPSLLGEEQPEIVHISHGFFPFSWLINRAIQQCWNDLTDLITEDANFKPQIQESPGAPAESHNIMSGKTGEVHTGELARRKVRLLEFTQAKRAGFIKLLVLSNWSRQAAEVSRLIDLQAFVRMRYDCYNNILLRIAAMNRDLIRAQMANPDLRTSAEVLADGKVGELPLLGFIMPEPLSPKRIMKVLRKINKIITMRLLLHDYIPRPFRTNHSVHDGRVKFIVPSEFELDLSIAEETHASQFFFVDLRFMFSPTSEIPKGHLSNNIDRKVNTALMQSGLAGCYNLLHNLALTLKIVVLFKQAIDLSHNYWLDTLRVDFARRTLVVQYWSDRPGPKNWIELGISKTRPSEPNRGHPDVTTSSLWLKWFRDGTEADTRDVNFDQRELCMEAILRSITSLHISHLLLSTYKRLRECRLYAQHGLGAFVTSSTTEPGNCGLNIQITKTRQLRLVVDHVTGVPILQANPPLVNHHDDETSADKLLGEDMLSGISRLRCAVVREEVKEFFRLVGWEVIETEHISPGDIRHFFPQNAIRHIIFSRHRSWKWDWMVAFTSSTGGDSWWIVQLRDDHTKTECRGFPTSSEPLQLAAVHLLNGSYAELSQPLTHSSSAKVANLLSASVEHQANITFLRQLNCDDTPTFKVIQPQTRHQHHRPNICLRFRGGHFPPVFQVYPQVSTGNRRFIKDTIRLVFHGVEQRSSCAVVIAHGRLDRAVSGLNIFSTEACRGTAFRCQGSSFSAYFLMPVGQPAIVPLFAQLLQLEAVIAVLGSLKVRKFIPLSASLTRVDFAYADSPNMRGSIKFKYRIPSDPMALNLFTRSSGENTLFRPMMDLYFPPRNPHSLIKESLVNIINDSERGIGPTLGLLVVTLPLLRVLENLCFGPPTQSTVRGSPEVIARNAKAYRFRYPAVRDLFEVHLGRRRGRVVWILRITPVSSSDKKPSALVSQLLSQAAYGPGSGSWQELGNGAISEVEKVEDLVTTLDKVVQAHGMDPRNIGMGTQVSKQDNVTYEECDITKTDNIQQGVDKDWKDIITID